MYIYIYIYTCIHVHIHVTPVAFLSKRPLNNIDKCFLPGCTPLCDLFVRGSLENWPPENTANGP